MLFKFVNRIRWEKGRQPFRKWFSKNSFTPQNLYGKLGVVGVPFGKGQKKKGNQELGLECAPDALRQTGFLSELQCLGLDVHDYGNVTYEPIPDLRHVNMFNLDHVAPLIRVVSGAVKNVLENNRGCLVLGGDHSIATGSIYGHMEIAGSNNVAVIYVDAHADINTDVTSPSGNIHGMTLALLARDLRNSWPESTVPGMDWLAPCLPLKNVAFIGLRSVDPGEAEFLCDHNVAAYSMEDVAKHGIHNILCQALAAIDPASNKSIHLSFDIDSLDSLEAPCTTAPDLLEPPLVNAGSKFITILRRFLEGEPQVKDLRQANNEKVTWPWGTWRVQWIVKVTIWWVRGGLTLREGIDIGETLFRTGRVSVVDLVEVNPAIGTEIQQHTTLEAAKHILLSMYGHNRRGNMNLRKTLLRDSLPQGKKKVLGTDMRGKTVTRVGNHVGQVMSPGPESTAVGATRTLYDEARHTGTSADVKIVQILGSLKKAATRFRFLRVNEGANTLLIQH